MTYQRSCFSTRSIRPDGCFQDLRWKITSEIDVNCTSGRLVVVQSIQALGYLSATASHPMFPLFYKFAGSGLSLMKAMSQHPSLPS